MPVVKVGRRLVVPVAPILELLCIPADAEAAGGDPGGCADLLAKLVRTATQPAPGPVT